MKQGWAFLWLLLLAGVLSEAGETDTRTLMPDAAFRTLVVEVDGNPLRLPVIAPDGAQTLRFRFDELTDEISDLQYELLRCDAEWRPSRLLEQEWVEGFNIADVEEAAFSRGTLVHYVNYAIEIPGALTPLVSGNYLLRVFDRNNPEHTVAQARFMVSDGTLQVRNAEVSSLTDIDANATHQQVTFSIDASGASATLNPFNDLRVVVSQNLRPDRTVTLLHPLRVEGRVAKFEHLRPLIFDGGNEYRRCEFISTEWPGRGVAAIDKDRDITSIILATDTPRAGCSYEYDRTQHGGFVVRNYDAYADSHTEADYVLAVFSLQSAPMGGGVYLEGELTGRRLDGNALMEYDADAGLYSKTLLLKQGAYNYQFLSPGGDLEGNHHQTLNRYDILVYYRLPGDRCDRLGAAYTVEF